MLGRSQLVPALQLGTPEEELRDSVPDAAKFRTGGLGGQRWPSLQHKQQSPHHWSQSQHPAQGSCTFPLGQGWSFQALPCWVHWAHIQKVPSGLLRIELDSSNLAAAVPVLLS